MKEYIEKIIEIILENVACDHEEDEDGAGKKYYSISYTLVSEEDVLKKCIKAIPARLIERPEITEEFINKQARELHNRLYPPSGCNTHCYTLPIFEDFIRLMLNELAAKINLLNKPVITSECIDKKATELHDKLWPGEKCGGQCNRQKEIKEFFSSLLKEES